MVPGRVRCRGFGAALVSALLACAPEPCTEVEGVDLWDVDVPGSACVLGDVVVNGRATAELAHLERIESITGSLLVFANPEWLELPRFASLRQIGGALSISDNPALTTLDAFPALEQVGGTLYIGEHPRLVSIDVGDGIADIGGLLLALNPELTSIAGLERIESVAGDFIIRDNEALTTLEFPALARVDGMLGLIAMPALRSADFPALTRIERGLAVQSTGLNALAGFTALEGVQVTSIRDNPRMIELDLTGWTSAALDIRDNTNLQRLAVSVAASAEITSTVFIIHNPALARVDGVIDIERVGWLFLADNDALAQLAPWPRLAHAKRLLIQDNASLTELRPWLPALSCVDDLQIFGNAALAPAAVDALLAHVDYDGTPRAGDNGGQTTELDPCPWPDDFVCDADENAVGEPGTGLCLADSKDCGA